MVELKNHPWCANVNWDRVYRKRVKPPYSPSLQQSNLDPEYLNAPIAPEEMIEEAKLEMPEIYYEALSVQLQCYSARYLAQVGSASVTSSESASTNNTPRMPNAINSAIKTIIQENKGITIEEKESEEKEESATQNKDDDTVPESKSLEEFVGLHETVVSLDQVRIRRNQYIYDRNSICVAIGDLLTPIQHESDIPSLDINTIPDFNKGIPQKKRPGFSRRSMPPKHP